MNGKLRNDGLCIRKLCVMRTFWRSTQVGRRGVPAKDVGRVTGAEVRIFSSPPKNSTSFDLSNFFIHCESNGISSAPVGLDIITATPCISSAVGCILFRNDDIQGFRLGDIQNLVLMICTPFGVIWYVKAEKHYSPSRCSAFPSLKNRYSLNY